MRHYAFGNAEKTKTELVTIYGDNVQLSEADQRDTLFLTLWTGYADTLGEVVTLTRVTERHRVIVGQRDTGDIALVDYYEVSANNYPTGWVRTQTPDTPIEHYVDAYVAHVARVTAEPTNQKYR